MADAKSAEELAAQAADAVRGVLSDAESRAAEIVRDAEAKAASIRDQAEAEAAGIRERGESDARAQIEAAKRALDELGGTLAAAASAAVPKVEAPPSEPEPETEPETPAESPGAPEAPVSPPADEPESPEPEQAAAGAEYGDAAERLVAMKLAVDGRDPASIEAELIEKFGPGDRTELLKEVLARLAR
jgi:hypothetical protein